MSSGTEATQMTKIKTKLKSLKAEHGLCSDADRSDQSVTSNFNREINTQTSNYTSARQQTPFRLILFIEKFDLLFFS